MLAITKRIGVTVRFWFYFIRLPLIGFTLVLPLLGGASGGPITLAQGLGLLLTGVVFHCFAYVLNDVIDLPLDRTQTLRADAPLVRGTISPRAALAFALAQPPLALALTALLRGGSSAYTALAVAYGLIAAYNIWGKHTPWPPLVDLLQGVGWAAMLVYGALITGGGGGRLTLTAACFVVLFITLLNGVHGGLRDLENDLACGARTTAIALGARPTSSGGVRLTPLLVVYTLAVQVSLSTILLLPALYSWVTGSLVGAATALSITVHALALSCLAVVPHLLRDRWAMINAGSYHLALLLTALIVLYTPIMAGWLASLVWAVHLLPLMISPSLHAGASRWVSAIARGRGAQ